MNNLRALEVYRVMCTAREIDERERLLVSQNLAHFHVSGAGHEITAALAAHLTPADWLHLHYRDKALLLVRGLPMVEFFRSLLCRGSSHSAGRQMSAHFSAPELRVLSMVGPVGNNALQAVGVAAAVKNDPERSIVVCSVGDGTTQEGEFLEAVAEAVRWQLPVLFLVEDNRYAISTPTRGKTLFDLPCGPAPAFYELPIRHIDGADVIAADRMLAELVSSVRETRCPQLAVLHVERLTNHTNADDQSQYRDESEISRSKAECDPLLRLRTILRDQGVWEADLEELESSVRTAVQAAADQALSEPEPDPVPALNAKAPLPPSLTRRAEYRGNATAPQLTMREAIIGVLNERLARDHRVCLYGQDVEDPKGDVFGLTRGLSTAYPGRVVNAPLSESTIVGTCIGRALAGQRPVAFIQFADFLPLAYNQILSELGSMYWRTNGGWQCPVIVVVTCGGYKPGLGPFHAQTLEAVMAHAPGVDVVMPSSAADAAGLLNAAFESPRPTIFLCPKSCVNLTARTTSADVERQFVPLGKARFLAHGRDLTLVTWGNPLAQCEEAVAALSEAGFSTDLIDLRSLSPWDDEAVVASAEKTGRLIVVHEDNHTCGFGAEVLATVAERANRPARMRRITRPDTFIPFHFGNQLAVLPSFKSILETCADLLECDVTWEQPPIDPPGRTTIRALGSGPADETVEVVDVLVRVGDQVESGQIVAEIEASKSVVAISATAGGRVIEICAAPGDRVAVDSPLLRLETTLACPPAFSAVTRECAGQPHISRRSVQSSGTVGCLSDATAVTGSSAGDPSEARSVVRNPRGSEPSTNGRSLIYMSRPACALGSRIVTTEELAANIPGWTAEEAIKRTGVERRHWIGENEDVLTMAISATRQLLDRLGDDLPPISLIVCSTTTPKEATPSIACQVATAVADRICFPAGFHAFDFNAACSGFLYGLRLACDYLRTEPESAVLLLTAEGISPKLNLHDPATCFLFGDAATATIVTSAADRRTPLGIARLHCFSQIDRDRAIRGSCVGASGFLEMDGIAVARTAYKEMAGALRQAMPENMEVHQLSAILPHPGSKRILQNVAEFLQFDPARVCHTLADSGNTSSSSIPLALDHHWGGLPIDSPLGFTAFGAGFTSAAAVGRLVGEP